MVLRPEAVRSRLLKLEEVIANLEGLREVREAASGTDVRTTWAIERGLQLGAEIILDIGNHILSTHFRAAAADYEDILTQLGRRGVIDAQLAGRLRGLGGFGNILVHGYLELDPLKVREHLQQAPADFSALSRAVQCWLEAQGPGS